MPASVVFLLCLIFNIRLNNVKTTYMYYLRNFDKQADAIGQKAYLPTIAIVGGVNKVGYFDGDASKDNVFTENDDFINVGEKETRVVCAYNVTQTTGATQLLYSGLTLSEIASMEVDGVNATVATGYTFTTTGEHTVKYTFKDNTTIGWYAFLNCSGLTSVTIGSGVTSIGNYAFKNCNSLTSVVIPDSVTSIGYSAFAGCTGLTSITIPDSVTSIGGRAFADTPWYKSYSADTVNQYGNIIYINNVAYQATSSGITSCEIKEGTVSIGNYAFSGCTILTSVVIPNSVTTIGGSAFYSCRSLTSVTIPNSVTNIGEEAFRYCNSLTSVVIPDSVTSIGQSAFYSCSGLTSVVIPDSVTSIGNYAFRYCNSLTSVTIGSGVTSIGNYAFENCNSLTSVVIPNSVTTIGEYAFYSCSGLTSVVIPDSVTSIDNYAFFNCKNLTSITYTGTVEQWKKITRGSFWHSNVPSTTKVACTDRACELDDK
jgi:hypothetical protein